MHGKTLGVIGCGRIGQEVAKCAKELGMQVIGYDPVMSAAAFAEAGLQQVELSDIWRQSDFITVHTPLTAETKGLLNAETLMQCKKGALTQFSPHPEMAVT
jgi:D-3-phosphoglycerate dehydrogenase